MTGLSLRLGLALGAKSASTVPLVPVDLSQNFTFNTPNTPPGAHTPLRNYSGWAAYSSLGLTSSERDNPSVLATVGTFSSLLNVADATAVFGKFVIGQVLTNAPTSDGSLFTMTVGFAGTGQGTRFAWLAVDESSGFELDTNPTTGNAVTVRKVVASTQQAIWTGSAALVVGDQLAVLTDRLAGTFTVYHLRISGAPVAISGLTSIAYNGGGTGTAITLGDKFGLGSFGAASNSTRLSTISASTRAGVIALTAPPLFVPSDFTTAGLVNTYTGRTNYSIAGTYSGTRVPTFIQYQVLDFVTKAVVTDWTTVGSGSIGGGNWSGTISFPAGKFDLRVRVGNDTSIFTVLPFTLSCGAVIVGLGQSNEAQKLDYTLSGSYNFQNGWYLDRTLAGAGSGAYAGGAARGALALTATMAAGLGIPVASINIAIAGVALATLIKGTSAYTQAIAQIAAGDATGRVAFYEFDQGQNDGNLAGSFNQSAYEAMLTQYVADLRTDFSGGKAAPFGIIFIARNVNLGTGGAGAPATDAGWMRVRAATENVAAAITNGYIAGHSVGLEQGDALHYSSADYTKMSALRNARAHLFRQQGTGYTAEGPIYGTPTRSGAVINVPYTATGSASVLAINASITANTASDPNVLTGWRAFSPDLLTEYTVSSAVLDTGNSRVQLTLSADPGGPVRVIDLYGFGSISGTNADMFSRPAATYASPAATIGFRPIVNPRQTTT